MLTQQNIEAELSYSYLHAVSAQGGFACEYADRHLDEAGVNAVVRDDGGRLAFDSVLTSMELHVQLKATFQSPVEQGGRYSYSLSVPRYDKLRNPEVNSPRILVILYLPANSQEWLKHSEDCLVAKRCAYWVSLRNPPVSTNAKHQTVYVPRKQPLSVDALVQLMTRISRREEIDYAL